MSVISKTANIRGLGPLSNHVTAEWRGPFGEASLLDFFLKIIATENVHLKMRSQALRFIGNTCADTGLKV